LDAIEIGDRAMLDGDFEAAIAAFRTASHETPGNPDILRSLAEALIAAGNPGEAIPAYTQILAIDPADQTTHYNLGVAHMHLGHYREAELTFQRLLQSDTDNLPALFNLAEAYREQHKLADARDTWQRCLAIDSENAEAHMRLAEAFWELRDFQAAERHFRTASTLAPDDLDTQLNFAAAARRYGTRRPTSCSLSTVRIRSWNVSLKRSTHGNSPSNSTPARKASASESTRTHHSSRASK
jgi:tetratricopeptide (TPR) repeat protein